MSVEGGLVLTRPTMDDLTSRSKDYDGCVSRLTHLTRHFKLFQWCVPEARSNTKGAHFKMSLRHRRRCDRESFLLTTYWSESTSPSRRFGGSGLHCTMGKSPFSM